MSVVSNEADAGETQGDDPRVDNEETRNDNRDALSGTEERRRVNVETQNDDEDGRIGTGDGRIGAGDEYEDVQIHDEDDQPHNKDNLTHDEDNQTHDMDRNQLHNEDHQPQNKDNQAHEEDNQTHDTDRNQLHNEDHQPHNEDHQLHNEDHQTHDMDRNQLHNEDHQTHNEDHQLHNEDHQTHNEDHQTHDEDNQTHDMDRNQLHDEDDQTHNEDHLTHDEDHLTHSKDNQTYDEESVSDEDDLKGSININVQKDTEEAEAEREMSAMADDFPRSSAAEIAVTSNGDAEEIHADVFQAPSLSAGMSMSETCITSGVYGSATEGIIESGPYKGRMKSGAVVLADDLKNPAMEKLELVRKWSINTYKCTRQILSEKLGRGSRTVDLELESQIEILRDNKRKYEHVVKLAQTLASQLFSMVQTQRQLGDAFADLSLKSPELHEEFGFNADTQRLLSKNGETLLGAINFFIASVNTLVDKTIEDTLVNIKQYETARVEYDAYRTDLEELNLGPRDAITVPKIELSQQLFQLHREKYERKRNDVSVKLKFLEENKVKVLHNQLVLFHNAIAAYYAGNQQQLEQTLKQFHIKLKMPGGDTPSWLEEQH